MAKRGVAESITTLKAALDKAAELTTKKRNKLKEATFAFPKQRKFPINDASHVRSAMSRFGQVKDVTDAEKKTAYNKILRAAKKFGIDATGFKAKWGKRFN
jgi:DNA gyrase/topoisomerase IV subunit A